MHYHLGDYVLLVQSKAVSFSNILAPFWAHSLPWFIHVKVQPNVILVIDLISRTSHVLAHQEYIYFEVVPFDLCNIHIAKYSPMRMDEKLLI